MPTTNAQGLDTFQAGSVTHAAVVVGVVVFSAVLAAAGRAAHRRGAPAGSGLDRAWAVVMLALWATLATYNLTSGQHNWRRCMPLHLCDVVGLVAPVAVLTRWRVARAIGHHWGLVLCTQAFVTPVLAAGPGHVYFWLYWMQHGFIVAAAAYEVVARGYRPGWRDWRLAVSAACVYIPLAVAVNVRLGTNYAYVGAALASRPTLVNRFGPWPARVPLMMVTGVTLMAGLTLAWPWNRTGPRRRPAVAVDAVPARISMRLAPPRTAAA